MLIEPSYIWSSFQFSFTVGQDLFLIRSCFKFAFLIGPVSLHLAVFAPPWGIWNLVCTCAVFVIFAIKFFIFWIVPSFPFLFISQLLPAKPKQGDLTGLQSS